MPNGNPQFDDLMELEEQVTSRLHEAVVLSRDGCDGARVAMNSIESWLEDLGVMVVDGVALRDTDIPLVWLHAGLYIKETNVRCWDDGFELEQSIRDGFEILDSGRGSSRGEVNDAVRHIEEARGPLPEWSLDPDSDEGCRRAAAALSEIILDACDMGG